MMMMMVMVVMVVVMMMVVMVVVVVEVIDVAIPADGNVTLKNSKMHQSVYRDMQ
jgi:hypothetical protein